jgi:hypothetical protein
MPTEKQLRIVRWNRAVYTGLLILYPADFRHKFGAEMADVFEAMIHDAIVERGPAGIIRLWQSALWECLTVAMGSRLASHVAIAGAISFLLSSLLTLFFFRAVS